MLEYNISHAQNLFNDEYFVTWRNTLSIKAENKGSYTSPNSVAAVNKLKYIIKQQIITTITSIINERRYVYQHTWNPTNMNQENIKNDYFCTLDACDAFARSINSLEWNNLLSKTVNQCNTTLCKLIPSKESKKHDSIANKVNQLKRFCIEIDNQLNQILASETVKV